MRNNTADPVELWKAWRVGALPSGVAVAYVVDDSEDLEVTKSITTFSVDKWGVARERVVDVAWRDVEGWGWALCGADDRYDPVVLVVGVEYLP